MKTETNKILLENTSVFDTIFENKNTVWRVTRLQSKICKRVTRLQEGKDYKSLSEGERELSRLWENLDLQTFLKIGT